MSDYDRFLGRARGHADHIDRVAARLLAEGRITQGTHDALVCTARQLLHDAYQAGRCEPEGVTDLFAELARVRAA